MLRARHRDRHGPRRCGCHRHRARPPPGGVGPTRSGVPVGHEPPRALCARQPALARTAPRWWREGDRALLYRAHALRHPFRRTAVRNRLRQVACVWAGEDSDQPIRDRVRQARRPVRHARLRRASRWNHESAATSPSSRRDHRVWLDDRRRRRERTIQVSAGGAATSVWAATFPQLEGMGGVYCEDCDIAEPTAVGSLEVRVRGVGARAIDRIAATRLWALSATLIGVNAFA